MRKMLTPKPAPHLTLTLTSELSWEIYSKYVKKLLKNNFLI